jgi:hypothetical protein
VKRGGGPRHGREPALDRGRAHRCRLAAGLTAEQITAEYPTVTVAGVRAAAAYGAALAREELLPLPQSP